MDAQLQEVFTPVSPGKSLSSDAPTPDQIAAIRATISPSRFATYLKITGHDEARALQLYLWNAQIGEAFHTPIQAVEVGLRNCINNALGRQFTPNWWECLNLYQLLDEERKGDLALVLKRIRNKNLELCTDQVVAGLSLGFWVGMLQSRYNPAIWSKQLKASFPNLPTGRGRKSIFNDAGAVLTLRNRISHHEPLISRDISQDFATVMRLLEWICPFKMTWIKPHCRVPQILRQKP